LSGSWKLLGKLVEKLASEDGEKWMVKLQNMLQQGVGEEVAETGSAAETDESTDPPSLIRLFQDQEIVLSSADGSKTIAQAKDVFKEYLDPNFKEWDTDHPEQPRDEANVVVHELRKNATFKQVFESLSTDLDSLALSQHQIIEFCTKHQDKLHQDGYATFFLFKVRDEYLVAHVYVRADRLYAHVYEFGHGSVWHGSNRFRFVSSQL